MVLIVVDEDPCFFVGDDLCKFFTDSTTGVEVVDETECPCDEDAGTADYAGDFGSVWVGTMRCCEVNICIRVEGTTLTLLLHVR